MRERRLGCIILIIYTVAVLALIATLTSAFAEVRPYRGYVNVVIMEGGVLTNAGRVQTRNLFNDAEQCQHIVAYGMDRYEEAIKRSRPRAEVVYEFACRRDGWFA